MWAYGQHFKIQEMNDSRVIFDSRMQANFEQASHASGRDPNLI